MAKAEDKVLEVKKLRVNFRTLDGVVEAVKGIDIEVKAGETVAIVGESGSGKSQTMMAAMRLLASNGEATGVVDYRGRNLLELSKGDLNKVRGAKISMIFQEPMTSLDPLYTIGNQLMEPIMRHQKLGKAQARTEALRLLNLVHIPEPERRLKSYPHEMSGGQRQRVMIAMALANDPDVLIADEPTTALDVTIQAQILVLLAELQKKLGTAIVFITHDLGIVRRLADRVYVMRRGEVVETGPTEQIFTRPQHEYTKMLLAAEPTGRKTPPEPNAPIMMEGRNVEVTFKIGGGFLSGEPMLLKAVDHINHRASQAPDYWHRRRVRIGQIDTGPRAAEAAAERRRGPFRRQGHQSRDQANNAASAQRTPACVPGPLRLPVAAHDGRPDHHRGAFGA